jgi:ABC-type polysaccharide/polyol phosphate export permease
LPPTSSGLFCNLIHSNKTAEFGGRITFLVKVVFSTFSWLAIGIGIIVLMKIMKNKAYGLGFFEVTFNFLRKELKVRYAESLLGPIWIVLYPMLLTITSTGVFAFVFQEKVGNNPYFLYTMIGFISWVFFSQTINQATRSLVWNRELVVNANFHKESIILSIAFSKLVDYLVNLLVFLFIYSLMIRWISCWKVLLILPILVVQLFFQIGLSLVFSALNVYYRDIQNIVGVFLQLLFYVSPIVYPLDIVPQRFRVFINYNPFAQIVVAYRGVIFEGKIEPKRMFFILLTALAMFILGITVFKKLESKFADLI